MTVATLVLVSLANRLGVPYPILLVLGGIGLGYAPGVPALQMPPSVVLLIFLPELLYCVNRDWFAKVAQPGRPKTHCQARHFCSKPTFQVPYATAICVGLIYLSTILIAFCIFD